MRATSVNIPLILELLALTPHALPQSEEGIQQNIDSDFVFVGNRCAVRLCLGERHVEVAWWLWDGTDKPAHRKVLLEACREIVKAEPGAASWTIGGAPDAPGEGTARRQESRKIGERMTEDWLPGVRRIGNMEANITRMESTVGVVIAALEARYGP